MTSEKFKNLLNQAIARELQVSIQYMWQHVLLKGVQGLAVKNEMKSIAIEEMKHAEAIAERLAYLGGKPTTKSSIISVGGTLNEMITQNIKDEQNAIMLYREIIRVADEEEDITTAQLFKKILMDEEAHHDFFRNLME